MLSFLKLSAILILLAQSSSEAYILRVCNLVPVPIVTSGPPVPILDKILAINVRATEPESDESPEEKKDIGQEPLPEFALPSYYFFDPYPFRWHASSKEKSITSEDMRRAG